MYYTKGRWTVWTLDPAAATVTCLCGEESEHPLLPPPPFASGSVSSVGIQTAWKQLKEGRSLYSKDVLSQGLTVSRESMLRIELLYHLILLAIFSHTYCTVHIYILLNLVHLISFRKINHCVHWFFVYAAKTVRPNLCPKDLSMFCNQSSIFFFFLQDVLTLIYNILFFKKQPNLGPKKLILRHIVPWMC
jgi:hypothetical protein